MEMLFDYSIAIAALKAVEIGVSQVSTKKTLLPPCPEYTARSTARYDLSLWNFTISLIHRYVYVDPQKVISAQMESI